MAKRPVWEPVAGPLPPGVQCRHQAMIAGWLVVSELVLTGTGAAEVRLNGDPQGEAIVGSLSAARRAYRRVQNSIRPRQTLLPL